MLRKFSFAAAWIVAALLGAYILAPLASLAKPWATPHYFPPDFMQFYFVGKLASSGRIAELYHKPAYEPMVEQMIASGEKRIGVYPFNRPPFEAFLWIPLTWFPYRVAFLLGVLAELALLGALVWKLPAWFHAPSWTRPFLLAFFPFLWSIGIGQETLLLALLLAASFRLALDDREVPAGLLLAACLFKPHLLWAIPPALLVSRKRKMFWSFAAGGFALAAFSFACLRAAGVKEWIALLRSPFSDYNPGEMCNVRALAVHFGVAAGVIAAMVVIVCFVLILRRGTFRDRLAAALLVSLLLNGHTYLYDLPLLAIVAVLATTPAARLLFLLPWPYLYARDDLLAWIFLSLACLGILAAAPLIEPYIRHRRASDPPPALQANERESRALKFSKPAAQNRVSLEAGADDTA